VKAGDLGRTSVVDEHGTVVSLEKRLVYAMP
jgi:hypothetical protein